ncbi:MAG: transcription termination factor NusA [Candidatus Eutrophobiaceae bacterium]
MNKEILTVVNIVSNEKGVDGEIIFQAIEAGLASATRKRSREDLDARVAIDRQTGDYDTFRRWEVIDDEHSNEDSDEDSDEDSNEFFEFPERQMLLSVARQRNADIQPGEFIEEPMDSVEYGRIAAQAAKQVIVQKVREAERAKIVQDYSESIGRMFSGIVRKTERTGVFIDLGSNVEGFIPRENCIAREQVRNGDRLRALLYEVRSEIRGAQLFFTRVSEELLIELFKVEVPEINEGLIDIVNAVREPGRRAKIAVRAKDPRIDPVGACVGMRGSRVQAVSNELGGERVEIISWHEEVAQFAMNALAPAEIVSIVIDEDEKSMDVAVAEENVAKAKGIEGQNVRLASRLIGGWNLRVITEEQAEEESEQEARKIQQMFREKLEVDEEVANILTQEGYSSLEEVAFVPEREMLEIEEFDAALVTELRDRANDVLLTQAINDETDSSGRQPAEDLLSMEGIDKDLAKNLANAGIVTMEDLAEQSVDELLELVSEISEKRAEELIMIARRPWFEDSASLD